MASTGLDTLRKLFEADSATMSAKASGSKPATGSGGNPNRIKTAGGTTYTFSFTSGGTVAGAFVNCNGSATQDNTTGTLFSAGDFSASKTVANGETLTVTYQVAM